MRSISAASTSRLACSRAASTVLGGFVGIETL
jgi:hypothetical protein